MIVRDDRFRWLVFCLFATVATRAYAFECDCVTPVAGENITSELVTTNVTRPVDVCAPPGDRDRLFVVEQNGRIVIVDLPADTVRSPAFLDIRNDIEVPVEHRRVMCCSERGLLGLAFHPRYEENGYFFVNYTPMSDPAAGTAIARYRVMPDDPERADPDSEVRLLTFSQPAGNHNGGSVAFSPNDGYLYIGVGDGGGGCDSAFPRSGQNPNTLLGKILRIDVDNTDGDLDYAIPSGEGPLGNPFVGMAGVRPEIWALGTRNPWRIAFDPENGALYIGDVGQDDFEEIDYQPGTSDGGENYEWVFKEGRHDSGSEETSQSRCIPGAFTLGEATEPVWEHSHRSGEGGSITGGQVYRGCRMPDLRGTYIYGDYGTGRLWAMRVVDGNATEHRRIFDLSQPVAFGTDGHGEIYICSLSGSDSLVRIVPVPSVSHPPTACVAADPGNEVLLSGESVDVTLDGSRSDDGDGGEQSLAYQWSKLNGPDGDEIQSPGEASTVVRMTASGEYTYQLTVDDGDAMDSVEVSVNVVQVDPIPFRRADANGDGTVDLSDGVKILLFLFSGDLPSTCRDAADADGNASIDLTDAIFTFNYLFLGALEPPAPGVTDCGLAPSSDGPGCISYTNCGT